MSKLSHYIKLSLIIATPLEAYRRESVDFPLSIVVLKRKVKKIFAWGYILSEVGGMKGINLP